MSMTRSPEQEPLWQEARKFTLGRDSQRCAECTHAGDLHVHHLLPRREGGTDDPCNLITLCAGCHAARHPLLQVSLSRRRIEIWAIRIAQWFDSLGEIPEETERISLALRILGKDHLRDGQLEVVLAALRGESILVIRPTGSGKSLCFQLPAFLKPGTAYVISPLKALMTDQVLELQRMRIPATFINGDLSQDEKKLRLSLLDKKALQFLYLTPERFDPESGANLDDGVRLCRQAPNFLVVDEAHCVDRWGDDFRPSYGRLNHVREALHRPPVLAFTATAGVSAQKRILQSLGIPGAKVYLSGVNRPNIALIRHWPKSDQERFRITAHLIASVAGQGKTMIFVPTVKVGEAVREGMAAVGHTMPFFHRKLATQDRESLLGRFTGRHKPELDAIICTNAFGMGIDVPNVRVVIHWLQPESVEDYLQELGRAGRDGGRSLAVIFKLSNDIGLRTWMVNHGAEPTQKPNPEAEGARARRHASIKELDGMLQQSSRKCFRKQVTTYFEGEQPRKTSFAIGLLLVLLDLVAWLFHKKGQRNPAKAEFCCDVCRPQEARLRLGMQGHLARNSR